MTSSLRQFTTVAYSLTVTTIAYSILTGSDTAQLRIPAILSIVMAILQINDLFNDLYFKD